MPPAPESSTASSSTRWLEFSTVEWVAAWYSDVPGFFVCCSCVDPRIPAPSAEGHRPGFALSPPMSPFLPLYPVLPSRLTRYSIPHPVAPSPILLHHPPSCFTIPHPVSPSPILFHLLPSHFTLFHPSPHEAARVCSLRLATDACMGSKKTPGLSPILNVKTINGRNLLLSRRFTSTLTPTYAVFRFP